MLAVSASWDERVLHDFRRVTVGRRRAMSTMVADHEDILQALRDKNGTAAAEAMRRHLNYVSAQSARHFRQ